MQRTECNDAVGNADYKGIYVQMPITDCNELKELNKILIHGLESIAQLNTSPVLRTKETTAEVAIYCLGKAGVQFESDFLNRPSS